jgi:putative transcriptional regulator
MASKSQPTGEQPDNPDRDTSEPGSPEPHVSEPAPSAVPKRARRKVENAIVVKGAPIAHSRAGQVLIAMPAMQDQRFAQTVIYLCAHTDEGAMGIIVNRPLASPTFDDLLKQLKIGPNPPSRTVRLYAGGPVDSSRGFVLHSNDWTTEATMRVDDGLGLTASLDILKAIAEGGGPRDGILALGYAGWGAGQLDQEMQQNAWLTAPPDRDVLFDADHQTKWRRAMATLRVDPALLSGVAGHA